MVLKKDKQHSAPLDAYETEIEESIPDNITFPYIQDEDTKLFIDAVKQHTALKKSKRINIRIKNEDLAKVKARAEENNIPYQTLLSTLVHKFAEGDISVTLN